MSRYYIRDVSTGHLMRTTEPKYDWVFELEEATCYLSYGEAQIDAKKLRDVGLWVSAVTESEAVLSLARLVAA